jgi:hypothetical protein
VAPTSGTRQRTTGSGNRRLRRRAGPVAGWVALSAPARPPSSRGTISASASRSSGSTRATTAPRATASRAIGGLSALVLFQRGNNGAERRSVPSSAGAANARNERRSEGYRQRDSNPSSSSTATSRAQESCAATLTVLRGAEERLRATRARSRELADQQRAVEVLIRDTADSRGKERHRGGPSGVGRPRGRSARRETAGSRRTGSGRPRRVHR